MDPRFSTLIDRRRAGIVRVARVTACIQADVLHFELHCQWCTQRNSFIATNRISRVDRLDNGLYGRIAWVDNLYQSLGKNDSTTDELYIFQEQTIKQLQLLFAPVVFVC